MEEPRPAEAVMTEPATPAAPAPPLVSDALLRQLARYAALAAVCFVASFAGASAAGSHRGHHGWHHDHSFIKRGFDRPLPFERKAQPAPDPRGWMGGAPSPPGTTDVVPKPFPRYTQPEPPIEVPGTAPAPEKAPAQR
jgi:hypothetical protein